MRAATFVTRNQINADLIVGADDALTLVDVVLTPEAVESLRTFTVKIVARISLVLRYDALAPVLTGLLDAGVVGAVAGRTHELRCARTGEVVDFVIASSSVETRSRSTFINVHGAVETFESGCADALEGVDQVVAGAVVVARSGQAFVDVDLAVGSTPPGFTRAGVTSFKVLALSVVQADRWRDGTFVDIVLAVDTFEAFRAVAGYRGRFWQVSAGGAV